MNNKKLDKRVVENRERNDELKSKIKEYKKEIEELENEQKYYDDLEDIVIRLDERKPDETMKEEYQNKIENFMNCDYGKKRDKNQKEKDLQEVLELRNEL